MLDNFSFSLVSARKQSKGYISLLVTAIIGIVVSGVMVGSGSISTSKEYLITDEIKKAKAFETAVASLESFAGRLDFDPAFVATLAARNVDQAAMTNCAKGQFSTNNLARVNNSAVPELFYTNESNIKVTVSALVIPSDCSKQIGPNNYKIKAEAISQIDCNRLTSLCTSNSNTVIFESRPDGHNWPKLCTKNNSSKVSNTDIYKVPFRGMLTVGGKIIMAPGTKIETSYSENARYFPDMKIERGANAFRPIVTGQSSTSTIDSSAVLNVIGRTWDYKKTDGLGIDFAWAGDSAEIRSARQSLGIPLNNAAVDAAIVDPSLAALVGPKPSNALEAQAQKDRFLKNWIGMTNAEAIAYTNNSLIVKPGTMTRDTLGGTQTILDSLMQVEDSIKDNGTASPYGLADGYVALVHYKPKWINPSNGNGYLSLPRHVNTNLMSSLIEFNNNIGNVWAHKGWNNSVSCELTNSTCSQADPAGFKGNSDNVVLVIDGDLDLYSLDDKYAEGVFSAATVIVLGNLTTKQVRLNANLIVMGDLTIIPGEIDVGGLNLRPRVWFGKLTGDDNCETKITMQNFKPVNSRCLAAIPTDDACGREGFKGGRSGTQTGSPSTGGSGSKSAKGFSRGIQ